MAYLSAEPGGTIVEDLLKDPRVVCYAHTINLCEVYYSAIRKSNVNIARQAISTLYTDGVIERRDMSRNFWHRVGELKARGGISLPDCFCIALAQDLDGEAVTCDHAEFDPLVSLGIVPVTFIR